MELHLDALSVSYFVESVRRHAGSPPAKAGQAGLRYLSRRGASSSSIKRAQTDSRESVSNAIKYSNKQGSVTVAIRRSSMKSRSK